MTYAEVTDMVLSTHSAVFLAAFAVYWKYGDKTKLFDKFPQEYRRLQRLVRDQIAGDLADQLRPVVRDSASIRSSILNSVGKYIEEPVDVTKGEIYYQTIRDFVTNTSEALVDYRRVLDIIEAWRVWAHRLSWSILILVILEPVMLISAVLIFYNMEGVEQVPVWLALLGSVPTLSVILGAFISLVFVHVKQGAIFNLKDSYDTNS